MVTVNAGGVSETVFESELFGHVRGAFTDARADRVGRFELADGAPCFSTRSRTCRRRSRRSCCGCSRPANSSASARRARGGSMSASSRPPTPTSTARLRQGVSAGSALPPQHNRNVLPPLRDRRDDIPSLATHFLEQHARRYRKNLSGFDSAAMDALLRHPWPGNVRELEHSIERAVLMARWSDRGSRRSRLATVAGRRPESGEHGTRRRRGVFDPEGHQQVRQRDRGGESARLSRSALYRRLERYGIEP
jgi:transcriptional regulator with GAF, ATPase, and Fis domain